MSTKTNVPCDVMTYAPLSDYSTPLHSETSPKSLEQRGMEAFAFSTTRHGGCSTGSYASFNANWYCGDRPEDVERNRQTLCTYLGIDSARLIVPHQTHDTVCRLIDTTFLNLSTEEQHRMLEGVDAVMTSEPGVCVCVSTADCIPVLVYDPVHKAVAAIHAGWRGTVQRIAQLAIAAMHTTFGTEPSHCHAVIGPGISLDSFEVGDEVYDTFVSAGFDMQSISRRYPYTTDPSTTKWHIDLPECNRLQLISAGVLPERITMSGVCTYIQHEQYFSARRLSIKSGRILNGIMLR